MIVVTSAVWGQPGTVLSHQKISATQGGFSGILDPDDSFGTPASLGDLDGDGVNDLVVGTLRDDDGAQDAGAVWVLFMNRDGTVKSHQKISATRGGFTGTLRSRDRFGIAITSLGDLDGDQITDIAVGATDNENGGWRGAVWVLFLNRDGTVKSHQKINETHGGFTGNLEDSDKFGNSLACLGDLDGDQVVDLAVGAWEDDDGGRNRGAAWILFLNTNGTVKAHQKISDTQGSFSGVLDDSDLFGTSVSPLGDLNGDGVADLAVGAMLDNDGGSDRGAVWMLFLNRNGTVKSHQKISSSQGSFVGPLDNEDRFGSSLAKLGDLNGDGVIDLIVGACWDSDAGIHHGAVWILFLDTDGTVESHQKINEIHGGFAGVLDDDDFFGARVWAIGDLDGDQKIDIAVGAGLDDDGGSNKGAVWILFLDGVPSYPPGDLNCDGAFNGGDIDPFFLALGDPAAYAITFPSCDPLLGDMNGDGRLDGGDIDPFFACLGGRGCP